jgi:hypothetical protein
MTKLKMVKIAAMAKALYHNKMLRADLMKRIYDASFKRSSSTTIQYKILILNNNKLC